MEIKGTKLYLNPAEEASSGINGTPINLEGFPITDVLRSTHEVVEKLSEIANSDPQDYLPRDSAAVQGKLERAQNRLSIYQQVAGHMLLNDLVDVEVLDFI